MQWQSFLDALNRKIRTSRVATAILTKKLKNERDLMSYLLSDQEIRRFLLLWFKEHNSRVCKSLEKAREFKMMGNSEFQCKNYKMSIESYTKSAIFAPADSEDLSVAIANRSAASFYLRRYEDSVKDIDAAIKLDYPEKLQHKLYLRAIQCYIRLGNKKLAQEAHAKLLELIPKNDDLSPDKKDDINQQVGQLMMLIANMPDDPTEDSNVINPTPVYGENPDFPSVSVALDKKQSAEKGRYVVANRDIKKGDILIVEKPFAFVLLDHQKFNGFCENCCKFYDDIPIPCTSCLCTLYCNVDCMNEGWSTFHRWECPGSQMGIWQQIGIAHLVLKLLFMCTATTDRAKFNEVQKLVTNFDKLSPGDLTAYGLTATMLTLYLSKYTDYFKLIDVQECLLSKFSDESLNFECDIYNENDKRLYVGSLLLRFCLQLIANGHAITRLNIIMAEKDKIGTEQQEKIASGIYLSASMMNHSCDSNIINSFMDQHLIIKATKDIAAGEEVLNCYGPHFRRTPKDQRQELLKTQYCFTCNCEACTNPEYQYFLERFTALKCPECSGALYNVHSYSLHCLDCGATPALVYQADLKEAEELFDGAQMYIELESDLSKALDNLKQCLCIRKNILYKYHEDITSTLDLIGKVYAMMGRWLESIGYLEHSIVAIEERFGSTSIELANELNKLLDICIRYLQEEHNTATKWYKNILKKTRKYLHRAEEIINLNYGTWNDACVEINEKKKIFIDLLEGFNI